jgi:diaminobutyrate-2-oxoglutarate transaminase
MDIFERFESEVRIYCRNWPAIFSTARGSHVFDEGGRAFLDFSAGAGSLNYGHNHPRLKEALLRYLAEDSIVHGLDVHTVAKRRFLKALHEVVLAPRGLDYKVQFPGPAGTNAVEAALKLARKYTGRETVVSFTNAFHGMTLGSLALAGNARKRRAAGIPLGHVVTMPYDGYLDSQRTPDLLLLERMLQDGGSGLDQPAAAIVETVQGEGGLHAASAEWLRGLADLCRRHDMLLIVDDVQMGCGRTGPFFSFEEAGVTPDVVCLSKSLSGYGLPLSLTLIRPELDVWEPGEHNGSFRGFNPAFVTATAALEFWLDDELEKQTAARAEQVENAADQIARTHAGAELRGRGLARGIAFADKALAPAVCKAAFERGLLVETSGMDKDVVKIFPPLTIDEEELADGIGIIAESVEAARAG